MRRVSPRSAVPLFLGALALVSCRTLNSVGGDTSSTTTGGTGGTGTGGTGGSGGDIGKVGKVDLLFDIDNSRSMADKQEILTYALGDLITGLTNPPCYDAQGNFVSAPGPLADCPQGSARLYQPVTDIHIGVISSSLGGHGSDACGPGAGKASNDDKGRLLNRKDPTTAETIATYQDLGFLVWDPKQALSPPGQSDSEELLADFTDIVLGVGQIGCGYEAQLESWYRFLADPDPPESITLDQSAQIVLNGTDQTLLQQRKDFLRPDSMLVVVSLTDENDCSIREEGQFYFAAQQKTGAGAPFHLPAARAICAASPADECCFSCGQVGPVDDNGDPLCPVDPSCKDGSGQPVFLDDTSDNINLRCFDQKRRFGIDFLYPIDRYVNALSASTVPNRAGELVPNPIFSDIDTSDDVTVVRDPGLVLHLGIVGVPWQDVAKNPADLKQGFKTAGELVQPDVNGHTTWDIILGDWASYGQPLDPFMRESVEPRSGENPVTGTPLTQPGVVNDINGHEWTIPKRDDLQYACIMPIAKQRDCSVPGSYPGCDCEDATNDNPLCVPAQSGNTDQVKAKAYPGLRELQVLKGIGDRAVIGSICAFQIADPTQPDYAYRPAIASLLDRMKDRLK